MCMSRSTPAWGLQPRLGSVRQRCWEAVVYLSRGGQNQFSLPSSSRPACLCGVALISCLSFVSVPSSAHSRVSSHSVSSPSSRPPHPARMAQSQTEAEWNSTEGGRKGGSSHASGCCSNDDHRCGGAVREEGRRDGRRVFGCPHHSPLLAGALVAMLPAVIV